MLFGKTQVANVGHSPGDRRQPLNDSAFLTTDQANHTHQPRDPLSAMLLSISPQLRMHAWRSK